MDKPFESSNDSSQVNQPSQLTEIQIPVEEEKSNIITARGTSDGLVLRVDGRVEKSTLLDAVSAFISTRRSFLEGHSVALEWIGAKPEEDLVTEISNILKDKFNISVRASRLKSSSAAALNKSAENAAGQANSAVSASSSLSVVAGRAAGGSQVRRLTDVEERTASLFDGIGNSDQRISSSTAQSVFSQAPLGWDDPDARVFFTTLRSGQKIETEHSIIIFGDVNSGAEVVSGGDIVILGTLRGIAHAGAYDETGGGRVVFCLHLQATQLRIGTVISRGNASERTEMSRVPEIARVEDNMIVVESYQSRAVWGRRRE